MVPLEHDPDVMFRKTGKQIVMPQLGESIAEGTIVRWLKQPGDRFERGDIQWSHQAVLPWFGLGHFDVHHLRRGRGGPASGGVAAMRRGVRV